MAKKQKTQNQFTAKAQAVVETPKEEKPSLTQAMEQPMEGTPPVQEEQAEEKPQEESSQNDQKAGSEEKIELATKGEIYGVKEFAGRAVTVSDPNRLFQQLLSEGRLARPRAIAIEMKRRGFFIDYETE